MNLLRYIVHPLTQIILFSIIRAGRGAGIFLFEILEGCRNGENFAVYGFAGIASLGLSTKCYRHRRRRKEFSMINVAGGVFLLLSLTEFLLRGESFLAVRLLFEFGTASVICFLVLLMIFLIYHFWKLFKMETEKKGIRCHDSAKGNRLRG